MKKLTKAILVLFLAMGAAVAASLLLDIPGGEKPMMLLTTLRAARSRRSLQQVVEGYLTRWRVEETIRFVKQAYEIEDVRLLRYDRLKAMAAIVLAVAYFAMAWLGLREKLAVLADHVWHCAC